MRFLSCGVLSMDLLLAPPGQLDHSATLAPKGIVKGSVLLAFGVEELERKRVVREAGCCVLLHRPVNCDVRQRRREVLSEMNTGEINELLEVIKRCCRPPGGLIYSEGVWTCSRNFTVHYSGGSLTVKPKWNVSWNAHALTIKEIPRIDESAPPPKKFTDMLWGALGEGLKALAAPEHTILWNSISHISA